MTPAPPPTRPHSCVDCVLHARKRKDRQGKSFLHQVRSFLQAELHSLVTLAFKVFTSLCYELARYRISRHVCDCPSFLGFRRSPLSPSLSWHVVLAPFDIIPCPTHCCNRRSPARRRPSRRPSRTAARTDAGSSPRRRPGTPSAPAGRAAPPFRAGGPPEHVSVGPG